MENAKYVAYATASLLTWKCGDEDHLRQLLGRWAYQDLLNDAEKEMVVQIVANWPEVVTP
jgi:hypothetical protein